MTYRSDIDGLRAVAVLAVILFHAGITGFSGGYVGVDVFFVISGFLITQILRKDHEAGRFSILKFYERRARRIMPALLVVLLLALAGGYVFLLPFQYGDLGKSTLATLAFISNIKFWRGAGYFEGAAEFTPLLHTWSLAVEEQFYILFPVVLGLVLRYRRTWLGPLVAVTGVASLLLSIVGVFLSPSATFYLIPTRAWELLIGAALALDLVPRIRSAAAREWLAAAGLAAIVAAVVLFTPLTYFPGAAALLPCVGTALIIQAGRDQQGVVARALGAKVPVFIGLISYSLYLYHFPIFAYARHWNVGELDPFGILACIVLTFVLATLSWRYVERPFRDAKRFTRNQIFGASIAGSAVIAALAITIVVGRGLPARFDARTLALAAGADDFDARRRQCIDVALIDVPSQAQCALGISKSNNNVGKVVLWGDSHAAAISPGIDVALVAANLSGSLVASHSCPPLVNMPNKYLSFKDREICRQRNNELVDEINANKNIEYVVLAGYWSTYFEPVDSDGPSRLEKSLRETLIRLRGKTVIVLLDTPRSPNSLPWAMALIDHFGGRLSPLVSGDRDVFAQKIRIAAQGHATVVSTSIPFCVNMGACKLTMGGRPILTDTNHLSASTARNILGSHFVAMKLFTGPDSVRNDSMESPR